MKKLGLLLVILLALLLVPATPVSADLPPGKKIILDNGVEVVCIGRTPDGKYILQATIGGPKYLDDLVTPIDARWDYDIGKDEWNACDNLFTATAKGSKVTVWYEGLKLSWQPDVFIGTKKQAVSTEQLLAIDAINENYFGNTLRWYYGDIVRKVRLIEGMLIEYYTISEMPTDDVLIISHSEKDAGFVWTRPAVAWDSSGKLLDLTVVGDDLTLTYETMLGAIFPITIDPDTTFTGSANDTYVREDNAVYLLSRNASVADYIYNGADSFAVGQLLDGPSYLVLRAWVLFDTSVLLATSNITNATLQLRGKSDASSQDFNLVVQSGMPTYPHDPPVKADYNHTYYAGDGGAAWNSTGYTTAYNNITLNATGIGWINTNGWTKFILRSSRDIGANPPALLTPEYVYFYSYEKGSGYYPRLLVTYIASAAPTVTTNDATYVTRSTARLNAYLDDDGGEYCDVRFQYSNVSSGGALEDFSGYVQVDPNGHINLVGLHHVDHAAYDNETAYIRDDKGAGNITAVFVHTLEVAAAKDDAGAHGYPWVVSNALNDIRQLKLASATYLDILLYDNGGTVSITLQEGWGGNTFSDTYAGAWNTTYYLTITKNGTDYSGDIYSDSNRLNLLTTLNLTLHANHTFRYVFAGNTYNDGTAEHIDVDVDNLTLAGGGNWTNTTWINDTYLTGDSPYVDVTNLTPNVTYYFRVQARNTLGVVTGAELNFTTYPTLEAPTDFVGYPDSTTISLTWTKGSGAANTMIRGQAGAYPANATSGKQVYAGTMATAVDSGLNPGTTYYYRSWSFDVIGYSDNFTDFLMTTSAYTEVTQDTPAAPTTPSSWWGMPDYTNLQNIAGYEFINEIADQYGIPYNTFWMALILIIIMCIGLFIYSVQHNVTVALMLIGVMVVVASIAGLLPLFLLAIIGIPVAGIMLVKRRI